MKKIRKIINAIFESEFITNLKNRKWKIKINGESEELPKIFKWVKRFMFAYVGLVIFFLILAMLFPSMFCDHDYIETENISVTCIHDGKILYQCSKCGKEYTEIIGADKISHVYDKEIIVVDATCNSVGKKSKKCIYCGNIIYSEIPMLAHNNIEISRVEPTCTDAGTIYFECQDCGTKKEEKISKLGHSYGEPVDIPPTCIEIGKVIKKCSRCDKELVIKTYGEIGKHDYILVETVNARNGADGYELFRCSVCQDEYKNILHYYVVYVSRNGIAHLQSNCSGMKYYTIVAVSRADGYRRCKRCSGYGYECGNCN